MKGRTEKDHNQNGKSNPHGVGGGVLQSAVRGQRAPRLGKECIATRNLPQLKPEGAGSGAVLAKDDVVLALVEDNVAPGRHKARAVIVAGQLLAELADCHCYKAGGKVRKGERESR